MSPTLTVEAKMLGQRKPLISDWHITLPPELGERMTLRELIRQVVLTEVTAFNERQEQRRFTQVLSAEQIQAGAAAGKIDMGGHDEVTPADAEAAVGTAIQAFTDGLYFVFLDDEQQTELDRAVSLKPASRLLFLRLVALAGG